MDAKLAAVVVGSLLAGALAGCGGSSDESSAPTLRPPLAQDLAAQSEAVARQIEGGDPCHAAEQVSALEARVEEAIAGGHVPGPLRRPLRDGIARLTRQVEPLCEKRPPVADPEDEDEEAGGGAEGSATSCDAYEEAKRDLERRKREIEETFKDDKAERERRKEEIEEEKKALEVERQECDDRE